MRYCIAWFAAALVTLTSGCGTVCNLADDHPQVYGGVQRDFDFLEYPGIPKTDGYGAAAFIALWTADLCVCALTDTVTIPAIGFRQRRARERFDPLDVLDHSPERFQFSVGANAPTQPASE